MIGATTRVARFLHGYARNAAGPRETVRVPLSGADAADGTLYPAPGGGPAPAWIVLHGITVPGREHEALVRFAEALRAAGNTVLIPDIPAWRALTLPHGAALHTIRGGIRFLQSHPAAAPGGVGVMGFSFGATQAIVAAADPEVARAVRGIVGFGGYVDLRRTMVCMMTGEHEWNGTRYQLEPDPYGRWIVGANFLAHTPGYGTAGAVADGLRRLAREAGASRIFAADPVWDALKQRIRADLAAGDRPLWDLFAAPADTPFDLEEARRIGRAVADAGMAVNPEMNPYPALPHVRSRIVLAHGTADRLIPFTETLRLHAALSSHTEVHSAVTALFAHSAAAGGLHPLRYASEALRFARLLGRAFAVQRPAPEFRDAGKQRA